MSTQLLKFMKRSNNHRFLVGFSVVFFSLTLFIYLATSIIDFAQTQIDRNVRQAIINAPTSDYFEYQGVEYLGINADGTLSFESTTWYKQDYPVMWNDVLRCDEPPNGVFSFKSVQNTNADQVRVTEDYTAFPWDYGKRYVTDAPCQMTSVITMDVDGVPKTQTVVSEFVIEKE